MIPTDDQLEAKYFDECHAIDNASKYSYARVGIICRDVRSRLLHQRRMDPASGEPCTFTRWVKLACPWSYATANAALRDVKELSDIPDEHLSQIPPSNFPAMKMLSTSVRAIPAVLEAAKTKHTEAFVEQIQKDYPEQHIERKVLMRFRPEEAAARKIEEALRMAQLHGANNRNEALELIANEAVRQWEMEDEIRDAVARMEHEPHP